jgi:hypothetical protein
MSAETDTFTMADVESIQLEPEVAPETAAEEKTETPAAEEKAASFIETFEAAKKGVDAPAEEAKAEPESTEEDSKPESRSASDFKKLKEERDNNKRELEKTQEKLAELEKTDSENLLKQLQDERDDLSARLKISAVERHPEFQKKYDSKITQVIENAKLTVGEHNAERVERLLRMDESEMRTDGIEGLFAELSPARQAKLGAMLAQVDDVKSERAAMLEDADASYKQLAAGQDAQREAHVEASNKLFDEVLERARRLPMYQRKEGDDERNAQVEKMEEQARNVFAGGQSAETLAEASLWAAAAPWLYKMLGDSNELNQKLQTQVTAEGNANPTVGADTGAAEGAEPKSFMEMFGEKSGYDMAP